MMVSRCGTGLWLHRRYPDLFKRWSRRLYEKGMGRTDAFKGSLNALVLGSTINTMSCVTYSHAGAARSGVRHSRFILSNGYQCVSANQIPRSHSARRARPKAIRSLDRPPAS